jgi:hypothetical protein
MPIAAAMARFWVTARISRPSLVKRNSPSSATNTTREKQIIHSRLYVTVMWPTSNAPLIHEGAPTSRLVGPNAVRTACCRISERPQVASKVSRGRP